MSGLREIISSGLYVVYHNMLMEVLNEGGVFSHFIIVIFGISISTTYRARASAHVTSDQIIIITS